MTQSMRGADDASSPVGEVFSTRAKRFNFF